MSKHPTIIGKKFNRLTPLKRVSVRGQGSYDTVFECRCDCGVIKHVGYSNLTSGSTKSCGCYKMESIRSRNKKDSKEVIINGVWHYYRRNAKMRGIKWELTRESFDRLILQPCYLCGIRAGTTTDNNHGSKLEHNGVDRVISSVGYTETNCLPCCKRCNQGKNNQSVEEFAAWVARVNKHLNGSV